MFELNAGVSSRELPVGFGMVLVMAFAPRGDFLRKGFLVRDAAIKALF